jgi:hypothetical protein
MLDATSRVAQQQAVFGNAVLAPARCVSGMVPGKVTLADSPTVLCMRSMRHTIR